MIQQTNWNKYLHDQSVQKLEKSKEHWQLAGYWRRYCYQAQPMKLVKKTRLEYINSNWYSLLQRCIPAVVWSRRSITDACVPQTVLMLSFCIFPTKLVNFRQDFPLRCCRETNILVNKIAIAEFCSTFGQVSLPFSPELGASKVLALVLLSMKPPSH